MPFCQIIPTPTLLLAAALWSSQWLVGVSASFSMVVEHGVEECFIIRAPKEKSIIRYVLLNRLYYFPLTLYIGISYHTYDAPLFRFI